MYYKYLLFIPYLCLASLILKEEYQIPSYMNTQAPKHGTMHLAHVGNPKSLYPYPQSNDAYPGLSLLYETLIQKTPKENIYVTLLAKNIVVYPKQIVIKLDPDAYFSHLQPITATDVIYSIQKCQEQKTQHQIRKLCQKIKARALNPCVLSIEYDMSQNDLWVLLSTLPIMPKGLKGIGSGPYLLEKHHPSYIQYQRNTHYWASTLPIAQGKYNFNTIQYKFYSSQHAVSKAFEHQDIDYYLEYSAQNWHSKNNKLHCYQTLPHPKQQYQQMLWYNHHKFPLEEPLLRKALHTLVDPAYINQWLFYRQYTTANGAQTPQEYQKSIRQRMIKASSFLDKGQWKMQSDGYRYKNGKRLELDLITHHRQLDPMLQLLKSHYRRIGIQLNIRQLSKANYIFQKQHHDYHLIIRPLLIDSEHKSLQDMYFLQHYNVVPKLKILYQAYPSQPVYLAHPLFKTIIQILKDENIVTPLWSLDGFRVGYHKNLRFIHQNQSFVDINTWWYTK